MASLTVGLAVAVALAMAATTAVVLSGNARWTARVVHVAVVGCLVFPKAGVKIGQIPAPLSLVPLGISMLALLLVRRKTSSRPALGPVEATLLSWVGFVIVRAIHAGIGTVELVTMLSWVTIPFLALTLVTRWQLSGWRPSARFVRACVLGAWFLAIYAFLQVLFGAEVVQVPGLTVALGDSLQAKPLLFQTLSGVEGTKYPSTYQNGNLLGAVAAVAAVLAASVSTSRTGRKRPWSRALLPMASLVILSGSRSAVLALITGVAFLLPRFVRSARTMQRLTVGIGAVLLVVFVDPRLRSRFSLPDLLDTQGAGRTESWKNALAVLHPSDLWFGTTSWGTGGIRLQEGWLGVLQQVGMVGALLLIGFVYRRWRAVRVEGALASGATLIVLAVLDSSYLGHPVLLLTLLMPVLLASAEPLTRTHGTRHRVLANTEGGRKR